MQTFEDWVFNETTGTARYSVDVNYRTTTDQALEAFAKICLGYVSAALKTDPHNYHIKQVFNERPVRVLVSSRYWDDGGWTGILSFNPEHRCFVISKGFYNKDRRTVSVQSSKKCDGTSAADVARELINFMHGMKDEPSRHVEKLKPAALKRGPKR